MSFQKGKSGNPSGRPVGAKGRATSALLERITAIVDNNIDQLQEDLESLDPGERVKALSSLLNYALPKKQAVSLEQSIDYEYKKLTALIENAPDEVIDQIAAKVMAMSKQRGGDHEQ